jgi:hypothetical protein
MLHLTMSLLKRSGGVVLTVCGVIIETLNFENADI